MKDCNSVTLMDAHVESYRHYQRMGVEIENHVRDYHPPSWRAGHTIGSVIPVSMIGPNQAKLFSDAYESGSLDAELMKDGRYAKYPAMRDAAISFFEER